MHFSLSMTVSSGIFTHLYKFWWLLAKFLHYLIGNIEIGINILNIVIILKFFHKLQHLLRLAFVQLDSILGDFAHARLKIFPFFIQYRLFDILKDRRLRDY